MHDLSLLLRFSASYFSYSAINPLNGFQTLFIFSQLENDSVYDVRIAFNNGHTCSILDVREGESIGCNFDLKVIASPAIRITSFYKICIRITYDIIIGQIT